MEIVISKMTFCYFLSLVKPRSCAVFARRNRKLKNVTIQHVSFHNSHLATNCKIGHEEMLADSINGNFAFI